ncbi:MAG: AAA family ATPase [Bacillota bacterium]
MRLRRFSIRNFKSISPEGVSIDFRDRFCILVGKNNAGKSNILEALGMLFGSKNPRYIRIEPDSYNDPSQPVVIEAELEGLNWGHGKALGLSDQQCGSLMHAGKRVETEPGCITFRMICPPTERHFEDTDEDDEEELAKQTFEAFLANRHEVRRNEALRRAAVKYLLIPPVRSHTELLSPSTWTVYGKFLREVLAESSQAEQLAKFITEASRQLRDLLQAEADQLTRVAKATSYVDAIDFLFTKDGNPAELLRNLSLAVTYKGRTEDISQVGTGTQSAVIIAVLELCLRHRASQGIRLFCIEEPELFLHPHAQRYVADLLRAIAEEKRSQVILTTHSASLLANTDIRDVIRIERDTKGHTHCKRVPPDYPKLDFYQRILNPETCEMVFADRVVLVEGPSEAILLPRISKTLANSEDSRALSFDFQNVSVINVGGKDFFGMLAELLSELGIDWRIVADRDALHGVSLQPFKAKIGISGTEEDEDQISKLRANGIAVLTYGEIEDYYPPEAIAAIANCTIEDVQKEIKKRLVVFDEPGTFAMFRYVIREHRKELCTTDDARLEKVLKRIYDQSLQKIRDEGRLTANYAKTGEIISRWLKLSKPMIALRVAQWFEEHPGSIPESLRELVKWVLNNREGVDDSQCS